MKDTMNIRTSEQLFNSNNQRRFIEENQRNRRAFIYSGIAVLSLYALAVAVGYFSEKKPIPYKYNRDYFTNHNDVRPLR